MTRKGDIRPAADRLIGKFAENSQGCWIWTGHRLRTGYGAIVAGGTGGKTLYAHRVMFEAVYGQIPEGLQIDHICRTRACVNPAHLEAVTQRENILRGESVTARHARQTHCKHGHRFTPENTIHKRGGRECRTCAREYLRRYYQRRKGAA